MGAAFWNTRRWYREAVTEVHKVWQQVRTFAPDADIVIFGHSHKYLEQVTDGKLWLNPGSCGKRRFGQEISCAVLTIEGENYQVQKNVLPQG